MGRRAKTKGPGDWQYSVRLRKREHIPYLSTREGVLAMLLDDGHSMPQAMDFLSAISTGGSYESPKGLYRNIHRLPLAEEEQLRLICMSQIKHDGVFGVCWWHRIKRIVWWCYHSPDTTKDRIATGLATSLDDIKRLFHGVKAVTAVRLEREGQPDPHREPGWIRIYPGRYW